MARITVEDCLENVDNRFELVMIGSKRARQLAIEGRPALLPEENDKPTVVALREIAKGLINASILLPVKQDFTLDDGDNLVEADAEGENERLETDEQGTSDLAADAVNMESPSTDEQTALGPEAIE